MKKYFTAVTILAFATVLMMSGSLLADETREQFERSSREQATVGLFKDKWDDFIDYSWFSGTLTNENYLWTNLSNLQSDNSGKSVNENFRDSGYEWSKDTKENILGVPGWESNDSFAFGYLGNPVGTEGWNMGFVYNYQTHDNNSTTESYNPVTFTTTTTDTSAEMVEHLWMLNGGMVLSDELGIGFSWYHWNNDHERSSNSGSYMRNGSNWSNYDKSYEYNLEEQGDTLSFGAYYQMDDDLAVAGVLDIDYNQTEITYGFSEVTTMHNYYDSTDIEGNDEAGYFKGNEDRDDFGFDLLLEAIKKWNGDFWERTEFYLWVGWHPEDGEYWGSQEEIFGATRTVPWDVDGTLEWEELNWGFEGRSFINFGDRVHFAWALTFEMFNVEHNFDYDYVMNPGTASSSETSYDNNLDYDAYYWSFPVALEVDFLKCLTGRVGARWTLSDYDGKDKTDSSYGGYPDAYPAETSWTDISTDSKTTSTVYSFGLGWRFNEYLQIDLTDFTDLTDMNEWQLSLTLMW